MGRSRKPGISQITVTPTQKVKDQAFKIAEKLGTSVTALFEEFVTQKYQEVFKK